MLCCRFVSAVKTATAAHRPGGQDSQAVSTLLSSAPLLLACDASCLDFWEASAASADYLQVGVCVCQSVCLSVSVCVHLHVPSSCTVPTGTYDNRLTFKQSGHNCAGNRSHALTACSCLLSSSCATPTPPNAAHAPPVQATPAPPTTLLHSSAAAAASAHDFWPQTQLVGLLSARIRSRAVAEVTALAQSNQQQQQLLPGGLPPGPGQPGAQSAPSDNGPRRCLCVQSLLSLCDSSQPQPAQQMPIELASLYRSALQKCPNKFDFHKPGSGASCSLILDAVGCGKIYAPQIRPAPHVLAHLAHPKPCASHSATEHIHSTCAQTHL